MLGRVSVNILQQTRKCSSFLLNPSDITVKKCRRRNRIIRKFLIGQDWKQNLEFNLQRRLLATPTDMPQPWEDYTKRYPYVFDFEWPIVIEGALHYGDMLFSDGDKSFLCVETKTSKGQTYTLKRLQIVTAAQASKYASALHHAHPHILRTEGMVATEGSVTAVLELTR